MGTSINEVPRFVAIFDLLLPCPTLQRPFFEDILNPLPTLISDVINGHSLWQMQHGNGMYG